jgi:hypothetical protein
MRPELKAIFQERFQGHEAPVDPGIWTGIQEQLSAAAAAAGDPVEELFRERFQEHQVEVDPSVWEGIGQQLGHAPAGTGIAGVVGWAAAGIGAVIVAAGLYINSSEQPLPAAAQPGIELAEERPTTSVPEPVQANSAALPVAEGTTSLPAEEAPAVEQPQERSAAIPAVTRTSPQANEQAAPAAPVNVAPPARTPAASTSTSTTAAATPPPASAAGTGPVVVNTVIEQLAKEVQHEALANGGNDPAGPPVQADPVDGPSTAAPDEAAPTTVAATPIFLPNTFTPNGDGINDTYRVDLMGYERMMIRIYSLKNNQLVFSTDSNAEWDGANCEKGYYLVAIEAITADGQIVTQARPVWLNRDPY